MRDSEPLWRRIECGACSADCEKLWFQLQTVVFLSPASAKLRLYSVLVASCCLLSRVQPVLGVRLTCDYEEMDDEDYSWVRRTRFSQSIVRSSSGREQYDAFIEQFSRGAGFIARHGAQASWPGSAALGDGIRALELGKLASCLSLRAMRD